MSHFGVIFFETAHLNFSRKLHFFSVIEKCVIGTMYMKGHTHRQLSALYEPPALENQGGFISPLSGYFGWTMIIKIRITCTVWLNYDYKVWILSFQQSWLVATDLRGLYNSCMNMPFYVTKWSLSIFCDICAGIDNNILFVSLNDYVFLISELALTIHYACTGLEINASKQANC